MIKKVYIPADNIKAMAFFEDINKKKEEIKKKFEGKGIVSKLLKK